MAQTALASARKALEHGEYGPALRMLEPLTADHPPTTSTGAEVRLLMATALMGQGHTARAAACCRPLQHCQDAELRERARELLYVLEAPALVRPESWNLTLPPPGEGEGAALLGRRAAGLAARSAAAPSPPSPPVGPTRGPVGFAALALLLLVLVLVASLLGGCMEVRTDLDLSGPGRLRLTHRLHSTSGALTPFQRRFAGTLRSAGLPFRSRIQAGELVLRSPVLPSEEALAVLKGDLALAAELAGVEIPPPRLLLEERNWLLGVHQRLRVELDLSAVPPLPGLDLALRFAPFRQGAVRQSSPVAPHPVRAASGPDGSRVVPALEWSLRPGEPNRLELVGWRWSSLGLGGLAIACALVLVLLLQGIRLRLGFGPPQLPA